MKIFIAGGTGVLGTRLIPQLVQNGHDVGVLSRSSENKEKILNMDAEPVDTSLFDKSDLIDKTSEYDIFVHIATSIPEDIASSEPEDWEMNEKIRIDGTKNLIDAAQAAECKLYIQQSAIFGYGHRGDTILDEEIKLEIPVPTAVSIPQGYQVIFDDIVRMERIVTDAVENQDIPAVVLRFGWFYSYDSELIEDIVNGNMVRVFRTDPFISIINVNDAVKAIKVTIENGDQNAGEIFNIVDDSDTTWREFVEYGANCAGTRNPIIIPGFMVKLLNNSYALNFLKTSTRVSNNKAKEKLDWRPEYTNFKDGLEHEIEEYQKHQVNER